MFNQTIIRVGIRYGVLCGLACFALVLVLYFLGSNPLGQTGWVTYIPIAAFIFLGIRYFKLFHEGEIGFGRGFRVGLSVSFYAALSAAMLLFLLLYLAGADILAQYTADMQAMLEQTKEQQIALLGEQGYEEVYNAYKNVSPSMLAANDFLWRFIVGGFFALVAAVFHRK